MIMAGKLKDWFTWKLFNDSEGQALHEATQALRIVRTDLIDVLDDAERTLLGEVKQPRESDFRRRHDD